MKQLVSILIPAFNAEKWIGDCIESAINQTWPWKEIIVIDDGSKDSTYEIAKSYTASNATVKKQENRGASAARNHALSIAHGDYIQWLDADDILAPDKIAKQMEDAEDGQTSRILLSGSWGRFYTYTEFSRFKPDALWMDLTPVEWLYRKVSDNLSMAIESWLVSRKLTDMAGLWNETLSLDDDGEYFSRVLLCSIGTRFIPESRVFVRTTNTGISSNMTLNEPKLNSLKNSYFLYIQRLRALEESARTRDACLRLIDRMSYMFYPQKMDVLEQMQIIADDLGGKLNPPGMPKKYKLFEMAFGCRVAKKSQFILRFLRLVIRKKSERLLFLFRKISLFHSRAN